MTFISEHFYYVFVVRRPLDDVIPRDTRIKHRKPIVMLAGNCDVLHSRCLGNRYPFRGIKIHWVELRRQLLVFTNGYLLVVHHPFAVPKNTIDTPMYEHPKLGVLKPPPGLQIMPARLILGLGGHTRNHGP